MPHKKLKRHRKAPELARQIKRYVHAKRFKRMYPTSCISCVAVSNRHIVKCNSSRASCPSRGRILRSCWRQGITRTFETIIERRSAIKLVTGYIRISGCLATGWFLGPVHPLSNIHAVQGCHRTARGRYH